MPDISHRMLTIPGPLVSIASCPPEIGMNKLHGHISKHTLGREYTHYVRTISLRCFQHICLWLFTEALATIVEKDNSLYDQQ